MDPMTATNPVTPRCIAKSKQTGAQCKQRPHPGATVCRFHGGAAPQVKAKAAARLAALLDPSLPLVAQRIQQGLYAMETKLFQKDGVVKDKRNLVNFSERREYAKLAMEALGIVAAKEDSKPTAITINVLYAATREDLTGDMVKAVASEVNLTTIELSQNTEHLTEDAG